MSEFEDGQEGRFPRTSSFAGDILDYQQREKHIFFPM